MSPPSAQAELFAAPLPQLPEGMVYQRGFLDVAQERALAAIAAALPLHEVNYKGYTARRRVASYGGRYDFAANRLEPAAVLPPELEPLRALVADWLRVPPQTFTQVLVAEYRQGTELGWHRDVPDFEDVVGVSLLADAVMRFRPYPPVGPKAPVTKLLVEPRSIYLLRGASRWGWQHSVAPARELRYSITFRTSRRR